VSALIIASSSLRASSLLGELNMDFKYYNVILYFDASPTEKSFRVYGLDIENAVRVATFDAQALGFKVSSIIGHSVEVLSC
jgi:hypothetical protein